jgi:gas vesicle protein
MAIELMQGKSVKIQDFSTSESNIVAVFDAAAESETDLDELLERLLSIGAQVLGMAKADAGVKRLADGIDRSAKDLTESVSKFGSDIQTTIETLTGADGELAKRVKERLTDFSTALEQLTGGENSPIRAGVKKQLEEMSTKLVDDFNRQGATQRDLIAKMLDPQDPLSPLRALSERIENVGKAVSVVQDVLVKDKVRAEIIEVVPIGGNEYETVAVNALQRVAGVAGDNCESTGGVTGHVARSKKGDATVDLKVGGKTYARLVMEAKNSPISKLEWEREQQGSLANRAATGFIGMCKNFGDMPTGTRIMVLDSQSIVLAFDPDVDDWELFALVYQVVKMNTLSTAGNLDDLNLPEINKGLGDAIKQLEKFETITKQVSAIENSAATIRKTSKEIRDEVTQMVESVQRAIQTSIEPEALKSTALLEIEAEESD